jgi:DNA ligase (NAD+)
MQAAIDAQEYELYTDSLNDRFHTGNVLELEGEVSKHFGLYHSGASEIPDWQYDLLIDRLKELKPNSNVLYEIGIKSSDSRVRHAIKMLSLDKLKSIDDVGDWLNRKQIDEVICEIKLDGVSIDLEYSNGDLYRASTRGDGNFGEDVTRHFKLASVPQHISELRRYASVHIRGEAVITKSIFAEHFASEYSNPRNTVAGVIRKLETDKSHLVAFYAYSMMIDGFPVTSQESIREFIKTIGFKVPEGVVAYSLGEIVSFYTDVVAKRNEIDVDIDGIVVKANQLVQQKKLGDGHKSPHWAFCMKFEAKGAETILERVINQVGRTGEITPVAIVEPVEIDRVTITRINLYNYDYIYKLALNPGDKVLVIRANDVIPRIESNVSAPPDAKSAIEIPKKCPECDSVLKAAAGSPVLYCTNRAACPAQTIGKIKQYVKVHRILGLGDGILQAMIKDNLVTSPADLYTLNAAQISSLYVGEGRVGDSRAKSIIAEIATSKTQELSKFIEGLCLPLVAESKARDIAAHFKFFDKFSDALHSPYDVLCYRFSAVDGVGSEITDRIYFGLDRIKKDIAGLLKFITVHDFDSGDQTDMKLGGISVSVTGTLSDMKRNEFQKFIEDNGGVFHKSPKKNTDFLVTGADPGVSKLKAAEKNNTRIMTEDDFFAFVEGK